MFIEIGALLISYGGCGRWGDVARPDLTCVFGKGFIEVPSQVEARHHLIALLSLLASGGLHAPDTRRLA
jgi:hypothetical protein